MGHENLVNEQLNLVNNQRRPVCALYDAYKCIHGQNRGKYT